MNGDALRHALAGERLPAAVIDLDAFERNIDRLLSDLEGSDKTLRIASKSVRHSGLLRRALDRAGERARGLMTFTLEESLFLLDEGFDDLLVAYPSVQPGPLEAIAERVAAGATLRLVADCDTHLEAFAYAARRAGAELDVVLELDVSYRPLGDRAHLGVWRSPLRDAQAIEALARRAMARPELRVVGLMAYEALIAGLPDRVRGAPLLDPARRLLKRAAMPRIRELRRDAVDALKRAGLEPTLVNGGGTGSLKLAVEEPCLTEVTAGSGLLCSHLFDGYDALSLEPAAFFAVEVCRQPAPDIVTCLGGGYIASGAAGADRLPLPVWPEGLSILPLEGAGEVQTPLRVEKGQRAPAVGEVVLFRHAKAGELAERFDTYLLVRGERVEAREPTYRGQGHAFL